MQTERVTFLTSAENKAALASRAAALGLSTGEYIRRRVDEEEQITPEQEAELAVLVEQVNEAVPKMRASIENMIERMDAAHQKVDAFLREIGVRE